MRRSTIVAITVLSTLVVGAFGLAMSYLVAPPPGAGHHCPSGSPPASCRYPPDQTSWTVSWTVGGLVIGLILAAAILTYGTSRSMNGPEHQWAAADRPI